MLVAMNGRVDYGNPAHIFAMVALFVSLPFYIILCRKLGKRFTWWFILLLYVADFALHFLALYTPYYASGGKNGWCVITFNNLCTVYVVFAPFLFLFGRKYCKDYLFFIGILSGLVAYMFPSGPTMLPEQTFADEMYIINVTRYYICHMPLVVCPLVMVDMKIHRLNYHRLWAMPFAFALAFLIIMINGIIMGPICKHPWYPQTILGPNGLFDRYGKVSGVSNNALVYGPPKEQDVIWSWLYPYLPRGLVVYEAYGHLQFVPVLWCLPFGYFMVVTTMFPLCMIFDHKRVAIDIRLVKRYFRRRKLRKA